MPDRALIEAASSKDFLDALSQQLAKDLGLLLGRRGQVQRFEFPCTESAPAWMTAVFGIEKKSGGHSQLKLFLNRKHAVRLGADLVRAPGGEAMAVGGDITDMVSDGLHEAANVCGAALARAFKTPLGEAGTCRMLEATWGHDETVPLSKDWSARVDVLFTGLKEGFSFYLSLADAGA